MPILLVDDNKGFLDYVQRGLMAEGYSLEVATTGRIALTLAIEGRFKVILLDLGLPDINGRDVCEHLRRNGVITPILMVTASDTLQDKVSCLRLGANDYITKPFAFEELLARIEVLSRFHGRESKTNTTEYQIADLILNEETHEVRRGDTLIPLTAKEFAILRCFMRMPGKLLSRPRLLEQVWGCSADPLTNVVDVYIRHLRRKIDDDFDKKLLKTVRGFGYKLDVP